MVTAKLLDKFQSSKIIFLPSGLDLDDAPQGFQWKGCGFLMAGNGSASTVRVIKSAVASGSSDMNESISFERADEFAGETPRGSFKRSQNGGKFSGRDESVPE